MDPEAKECRNASSFWLKTSRNEFSFRASRKECNPADTLILTSEDNCKFLVSRIVSYRSCVILNHHFVAIFFSNQENYYIVSFYKLLTSKSLMVSVLAKVRCLGMLLLLLLDLCVCSLSLRHYTLSEANPVHLSDASSSTAPPASVRCMQSLPALASYSTVTVSLSPGA